MMPSFADTEQYICGKASFKVYTIWSQLNNTAQLIINNTSNEIAWMYSILN